MRRFAVIMHSIGRSTFTAAAVRDLVADGAGWRACGGAGDWVRLSRSRVVTQHQDATAAAVTVADDGGGLLRELLGRVAVCFPRRETRRNAAAMVSGLLMELEDRNCWTIAEAVGHAGPHRLQHLLSRAVWDDQRVVERAAAWAAGRLDDGEAVLIVDETADAKSSTDAAGAARQYSGTLAGIALCQVAVTLTYASGRGHALIDRALYLPEARAADGEHRELAGIPDEVMFATKPELAGQLLERAHERGVPAAFAAGDEVHGGRELRMAVRGRHGLCARGPLQYHPLPSAPAKR